MTKKSKAIAVFTGDNAIEVCDKLLLLINLLESKKAPVEDVIMVREALRHVSNKKNLEVPIETLRTFNQLWKKYKHTKKNVIKQQWVESERGWGQRPDGYSLHLSKSDLKEYISEYWKSMPRKAPDEYSRPEGKPTIIEVDGETYEKIKKTKYGLRYIKLQNKWRKANVIN